MNCKNDTSPPIVNPAMLLNTIIEPRTDVSTKFIFPRFPTAGPRMFANFIALFALLNNAVFSLLKRSSAFFSYENTFTTFRPSIISSTYPFTIPIFLCCAV